MDGERTATLKSRNQLTQAEEDEGKLHGGSPGVLGDAFSGLRIDASTSPRPLLGKAANYFSPGNVQGC